MYKNALIPVSTPHTPPILITAASPQAWLTYPVYIVSINCGITAKQFNAPKYLPRFEESEFSTVIPTGNVKCAAMGNAINTTNISATNNLVVPANTNTNTPNTPNDTPINCPAVIHFNIHGYTAEYTICTAARIPSSLSDAANQAIQASLSVLNTGHTRIFIEVDLTSGDATYTMLKNSIPLIRLLTPLFSSSSTLHILLPDAGSAALVRRDWDQIPDHISLKGLEEAVISPDDAGVMIVVPRASEVSLLPKIVDAAQGIPVVMVNPDLVDMGVTGLSLNARRLRKSLIDTFESAYYLKTFGWGVLLRAYPGNWGVWVDADNEVGFRLVGEVSKRPSMEEVEQVLTEQGEGENVGVLDKIARFLKVYMKG